MISLNNIQFAYDERRILEITSLDFPKGQITGILGPNGAGKTTLLKLMSSSLLPTRGDITIFGKIQSTWSRRKLAQHVAYVPQETPQIFPMRAIDLVLLGRLPFSTGFGFASQDDQHMVFEAMQLCDCWDLRDRYVGELSGGERQRIILARALAQTPQLLLLDEPTTFMDIRHQSDVVRILRDWVSKTNGTVIAVLHDLNLAAQICTHVVLLKGGQVYASGPTEKTLSYKNVCATFDADVYVGINEVNGRPYFVPM